MSGMQDIHSQAGAILTHTDCEQSDIRQEPEAARQQAAHPFPEPGGDVVQKPLSSCAVGDPLSCCCFSSPPSEGGISSSRPPIRSSGSASSSFQRLLLWLLLLLPSSFEPSAPPGCRGKDVLLLPNPDTSAWRLLRLAGGCSKGKPTSCGANIGGIGDIGASGQFGNPEISRLRRRSEHR